MNKRTVQKWITGDLTWRRALRSALLVILIVYGAALVGAALFADSIIFQPPPATYAEGEPYLQLPTRDGQQLTIRYLPHPNASHTILYSHGNAEDLGDIQPILEAFHAHGFSIIAYDYSGYGTSTGTPSEHAAYANISTVYEYLLSQQHLQSEQIIVFGRSVGSGPSVELATNHPVGGLILEGAFTSAFRVVTRIPIFPFDRFRNLHKIASVACPVLIIHGRQDEVVLFSHGQALCDKATAPKMHLWIDTAHHNDVIQTAGPEYWTTITKFIDLVDSAS